MPDSGCLGPSEEIEEAQARRVFDTAPCRTSAARHSCHDCRTGILSNQFLVRWFLSAVRTVIEAYAATSGKTRESAGERDGQQAGDPVLATKAIMAVTQV